MADNRTDEIEKARQQIQAAIEKLGDKVPPKARPLIEEAFIKMKVDNTLPKDAIGLSPEVIEMMYQHGYKLFQNGKYKEALNVFNFLRQLDISDIRFSFAIAACYHYSKDYLDAAANYVIYKYMDPLNPIPSFHLYDCYMKANYPVSALFALEEALVLAERSPQYAVLKEKILLEIEHAKEAVKNDYYKNHPEESPS